MLISTAVGLQIRRNVCKSRASRRSGNAHSRYFGDAAYHYMVDGKAEGYNIVGKPNPNPENKQLLIIPGATHCDLYDGGYTELNGKGETKNLIPGDTLAEFFTQHLK